MDNVTHSLVGCLLAEATAQIAPKKFQPSPSFRRKAYWTSLIASNLPDADFLYASALGGKLGYLLHHRGHTHTLIAILPSILVCLIVPYLMTRWKKESWTAQERNWFAGLAGLGLLFHIGLDWMNSYGVHPFWPLNNEWFYADTLFIVEPWGWIAIALPLLFCAQTKQAKVVFGMIVLCALGLLWTTSYVWKPAAAFVTTVGVLSFFAMKWWRPINVGLVGFFGMIVTFAAFSQFTRSQVEARFGLSLNDVVLSPHPSNPLCWDLKVVEHDLADVYYAHKGTVAAIPDLVPVSKCITMQRGLAAAPTNDVLQSDDHMRWNGTYARPASQLRELVKNHCEFAALMKFTRVPFWDHKSDGMLVGDVRYDRGSAGFATFNYSNRALASNDNCPPSVPPWVPPRQDILESNPAPATQPIESPSS